MSRSSQKWHALEPKKGIGVVRFGMAPGQVRQLLGKGETWEEWMGGNRNDSILYPGLIFMFDKCNANGPLPDGRLEAIDAHRHAKVTLFGTALAEWRRETLVEELEARGYEPENGPAGDISVHKLCMEAGFDGDGRLEIVGIEDNWLPRRAPKPSER
jgi:hypothetical protein